MVKWRENLSIIEKGYKNDVSATVKSLNFRPKDTNFIETHWGQVDEFRPSFEKMAIQLNPFFTSSKNVLLDRHKLIALFVFSVLETKPLSVNFDSLNNSIKEKTIFTDNLSLSHLLPNFHLSRYGVLKLTIAGLCTEHKNCKENIEKITLDTYFPKKYSFHFYRLLYTITTQGTFNYTLFSSMCHLFYAIETIFHTKNPHIIQQSP